MTPDWLTTLIGLGAVRFYHAPPSYFAKVAPDGVAAWSDGWEAVRFGGVLGDFDEVSWHGLTDEQREGFVRFATDLGLDLPANQARVIKAEADEVHAQIIDLAARHDLMKGHLMRLALEQTMVDLSTRLQQVRWMYESGSLKVWPLDDEWIEAFASDLNLAPHRSVPLDEGVTAFLARDNDLSLVFIEAEAMRRFCAKHDLWKHVEWALLLGEIDEAVGERERIAEWVAGWREFQRVVDEETSDVDPV